MSAGDLLRLDGALGRINRLVRHHGSQAAFARTVGIAPAHLHQMLSGIRPMDVRVLAAAGLRQVTRFEVVSEPEAISVRANAGEAA